MNMFYLQDMQSSRYKREACSLGANLTITTEIVSIATKLNADLTKKEGHCTYEKGRGKEMKSLDGFLPSYMRRNV